MPGLLGHSMPMTYLSNIVKHLIFRESLTHQLLHGACVVQQILWILLALATGARSRTHIHFCKVAISLNTPKSSNLKESEKKCQTKKVHDSWQYFAFHTPKHNQPFRMTRLILSDSIARALVACVPWEIEQPRWIANHTCKWRWW